MKNYIGFFGIGFLVLAFLVIAYQYHGLDTSYRLAQESYASSSAQMQYQNAQLADKLNASDSLVNDLKTLLGARTQESQAMGQQVQNLSSTVGTLDKLVHTDKELLEKYSSVYFLNENYVPQGLTLIGTEYLDRPEKPEQFLTGAYAHLTALLDGAKGAQIPLQVLSAYRSFGTQSALKTSYKVTYGAGTANSFSADQGYSEHQLGTAVDFTTPTIGSALVGFDKSAAYPWLQGNAYKYGFILSYPKGNSHFVFEPWHWRYIGVELATKLHDAGQNFYDLDQREIDTYLVKFFD